MKDSDINDFRRKVREESRSAIHGTGITISDDEAYEIIEDIALKEWEKQPLSVEELRNAIKVVFYSLRCELDVLTPLIEDESVTEIMVNGYKNIYIERDGKVEPVNVVFDSVESLEEVIRRIAARVHREINERSPILDARLESGARVNAVYKNIALGGPSLSIRKFPETALDMNRLIESGTITEEAAMFLSTIVRAGYNVFVSGGTSSGKTTFLNVLSEYIPEDQRVVLIEDSAELQLRNISNLVRLECRNANIQGKGEINMDTLIRTSLRMRPDWIIVGEIRGEECSSMLQAMNTGHSGMSTGHANSIKGMLSRMEAMYLQKTSFPIESVRAQIAQGIDFIVHMGRISGKGRKVLEIAEIQGFENNKYLINSIFNFKIDRGLIPTGNEIANREKLELSGLAL